MSDLFCDLPPALRHFWLAVFGLSEDDLGESPSGWVIVPRPEEAPETGELVRLQTFGDLGFAGLFAPKPAGMGALLEPILAGLDPAVSLTDAFPDERLQTAGNTMTARRGFMWFRAAGGESDADTPPGVRAVKARDRATAQALRALFSACEIAEWEDAGLDLDAERGWVLEHEGHVLAYATAQSLAAGMEHLAWIVHPDHRGRGIGGRLLDGVIAGLEGEGVLHARTDGRGTPAARTLISRGFRMYSESLVMEVTDLQAGSPP